MAARADGGAPSNRTLRRAPIRARRIEGDAPRALARGGREGARFVSHRFCRRPGPPGRARRPRPGGRRCGGRRGAACEAPKKGGEGEKRGRERGQTRDGRESGEREKNARNPSRPRRRLRLSYVVRIRGDGVYKTKGDSSDLFFLVGASDRSRGESSRGAHSGRSAPLLARRRPPPPFFFHFCTKNQAG